jgi:YhcH/YjgK/YiaL family protein
MENIEKWYNSKSWANELKLEAYPGMDINEFASSYNKHKEYWDTAFEYLQNLKADSLKPGKYPLIGDDVYVVVMNNKPMSFNETKWEAHRKYIDIQHVVKGVEKMGMAPYSNATETEPYNETNDVGFYNIPEGFCNYYIANPSNFLVFFPSQAHRPSIITDDCTENLKIVIKIRY